MKIIVASDSFKGTLSSVQITTFFAHALKDYPHITPVYLPIADGGEGSLDAVSYQLKGTFIELLTANPYFEQIKSKYYLTNDHVAYIETATTAGLPLIKELNPLLTSTYGVGEQVKDAVSRGAKKIYVFLGGSATNDFGAGLFSALGTKFYNNDGHVFIPTGGTLSDIKDYDLSATNALLKDVELIGLYDVTNTLYGKNGAAYIYAPQKGASSADVTTLDHGLKHLAHIVKQKLQLDLNNVTGAGAAGGLGAGIISFARGKLKQGINEILNVLEFKKLAQDATYIITGEGKLDHQSFSGKVISGIASLAKDTKIILLVGSSEVTLKEAQSYYPNIVKIIETNAAKLPFNEVKKRAEQLYITALEKLLKDL